MAAVERDRVVPVDRVEPRPDVVDRALAPLPAAADLVDDRVVPPPALVPPDFLALPDFFAAPLRAGVRVVADDVAAARRVEEPDEVRFAAAREPRAVDLELMRSP